MKNFLDLAKKRKTTYEFNSKTVSKSNLKKILEAARWAPSCDNTQPWHFIVVKNKEKISQLMSSAYFGAFHGDPPVIIAFILRSEICNGEKLQCVDENITGIVEGNLCISMAAISAVFEAEDLGINSALLTPIGEKAKGFLKIKKEDSVPIMVALGYKEKDAFQKERTRKSLKEISSEEVFKIKK
ncbi:nitroreductase family protein [Candidatus Woesearchaeota archaeon]|nr:nitroreductase family protein [Candidatus Woesearchaeota archaeon]